MSCPRPRPRAMSKSDTWPGGVAMESLSNMDSAGSCDSVISVNSGYSEDSMEHLSAEERACLMYLEETIEALEVQEDSGLSNDEPDPGLQAGKMGWLRVNDISSLKSDVSGGEQKSEEAEHHAPNPTSEPRFSPAANTTDLQTSVDLMTQPQPPATESLTGDKIHSSATKTGLLFLSKDGDGKLKIVSRDILRPDPPTNASEIDVGLIPPPSDFMDEPGRPPQPEKRTKIDLKQLQQRASAKRTSVSSTVTPEPPNRPPDLNPLTIHSGPLMSPPPEAAEPRSPPVVAPKPKKLPANIILKSHKATIADGNGGHSVPASSDRLLLDPQRVHIEALRKLGLLKSDEAESDPALSPKHSPKSTRSWAAPRSPISPKAPHTPPPTVSYTRVNSPSPVAESPSGTPPAPAVPPPDILPAPTAFSDPGGHLLSDNELSLDATANAQVNAPPRAPPAMAHHLTPPKVKSATLERSGLGLGSYIASQDLNEGKQSPGQLRNNRPRPASLGSGKEFSSAQGGDSQAGRATSKEPDLRRSLPAFQHAGDSQKLPRSQGISVLICPRAENEDNRRKALKRLGLLRD